MKKMNEIKVSAHKYNRKSFLTRVHRDQKGFNILGFLLLIAVVAILALLVIPNINLFLGTDKKINAANLEAFNIRAAAIAYYENNNGKYPADSDVLWTNPPGPGDYVGQPRAYYTFDVGNGRILDATTDDPEHVSVNAWTGIRWDYTSGSWVKP